MHLTAPELVESVLDMILLKRFELKILCVFWGIKAFNEIRHLFSVESNIYESENSSLIFERFEFCVRISAILHFSLLYFVLDILILNWFSLEFIVSELRPALLELAAPSLTQFHFKTGLGQILNTKYQVKYLQSKYVYTKRKIF